MNNCLKGTAHRFSELDRKLVQLAIDMAILSGRAERLTKECEGIYKEFLKIEKEVESALRKKT